MLPTSHPVPIQPETTVGPTALADAFSEFSAAAGRLENSYHQLQTEVARLRAVLAERNRDLRTSQAENSQMRLALRQIVDALPCGVLVLDETECITLMNPEAARLLSLEPTTARKWSDVPADVRWPLRRAVHGVSATGERDICLECQGEKRWLAVRNRELCTYTGDPEGDNSEGRASVSTIVILRDVTDQKKLEAERETARNVVALAEMSAVLAHEIRNPLASLELFAGLLKSDNPTTTGYVSHLQAGIRTLSATVNNVLRFHGGGGIQLSPIHLCESLRRAVEFVSPLAEQRQIQVLLDLGNEAGDWTVEGDEDALQQVFLNIALNAFRHTNPGGRFQVRLQRTEDSSPSRAEIEFEDNGCGIGPDALPHIFEAGFSADGHSSGLGLAVCRRIVEQHGGTLRADSQIGNGSKFRMELPLRS